MVVNIGRGLTAALILGLAPWAVVCQAESPQGGHAEAAGAPASAAEVEAAEAQPPSRGAVQVASQLEGASQLADGAARIQRLLATYRVEGEGGVARVRYAALATDRAALDAAVAWFAATDPAALPDAPSRRAYWLNGYNVSMIAAVLDSWGGDPAWSVSASDFGVFLKPVHSFGGHRLSLNDVEHVVLRGDTSKAIAADVSWMSAQHQALWDGGALDPRIHMALNCASVGCPSLAATPFAPATLDAQLSALSAAYVDDPRRGAGPSGISEIFKWYAADFEAGGGVERFIRAHRRAGGPVAFDQWIPYSWKLNVAEKATG